jgi:hypothetical protein
MEAFVYGASATVDRPNRERAVCSCVRVAVAK